MKYDVIIIGSGLGGLQCGYILSKHGMKVCVLEQNSQAGGCLQTFRRGRNVFDTGFHYVGGLDEGQPLYNLFDYFGLMDLPWHKMDENGFDEVVIGGKSYMFANGYERFAETLAEQFPSQRENLKRYVAFLKNVSDNIFDSFKRDGENEPFTNNLFARPAYGFLKETIDDELLRNVLSGTSLKMELSPSTLPLYTFAQINSSFIQSAWRLRGGGSLITDSLIKSIREMGGDVRVNAEVTSLIEKDGKIVAAEINGTKTELDYTKDGFTEKSQFDSNDRPKGELIEADHFIADTHPAIALSLIKESQIIRNIYRKRINNLTNTFGMFTANISLKENVVPYQNRNIYVYKTGNVWQYSDYKPENINSCALVSFHVPEDGSLYTRNIDILAPMYWQEVEQWENTKVGRRGDEYLSYKNQKADAYINLVAEYIEGSGGSASLADSVEKIYSSTSLSYRDYTGTPYGTAYGIRKNYEQLLTTLLSPRTPEPNLFLTGQNLNLHGVLGVSMTSFFTCAEILGMDTAIDGLRIKK